VIYPYTQWNGKQLYLSLYTILQVVFRPQQSKHKSLIAACSEFEERLSDCKDLLFHLDCKEAGQLEFDRIFNWQVRFVGTDFNVFYL
jgi:hypothetical protein